MISWTSAENHLLLNPRLPAVDRARFESAWQTETRQERGLVGIATSGSTGTHLGKLILLSKEALLTSAAAVNAHFQSGTDDIWLKMLPSFHVGGIGIFARAHLSGARVLESTIEKWSPREFHHELVTSAATMLSLVPTQLFDLVQLGLRAPPKLRAVVIGGGRLEPDLHTQALQLGWPAHVSYGFTECCSQIATARRPQDPRPEILSHVQVALTADGHFRVKSASLLHAQLTISETGHTRTDPKVDGWFSTEDLGRIEADQTLTVSGRSSDFIKVGGEGVVLSRLEARLDRVRAALGLRFDCAILAAVDERLGARLVLVHAPAPAAMVAALVREFNAAVLPFERIRDAKVVPALPRSALGKLLRGATLQLVGLKLLPNVPGN